ncbi:hypothetical protein [Bacillus dicomae]|nr:hypothetical protein [Bacillus dicomae]
MEFVKTVEKVRNGKGVEIVKELLINLRGTKKYLGRNDGVKELKKFNNK